MTYEQAQELVNDLSKQFYIIAAERGIAMKRLSIPGQVILNILNSQVDTEMMKLEIGRYWFGNKFEDVMGNKEMIMRVITGR